MTSVVMALCVLIPVGLMSEGPFENGAATISRLSRRTRSRLRPAQDVLGDQSDVGRCDTAGPRRGSPAAAHGRMGREPRIRIIRDAPRSLGRVAGNARGMESPGTHPL
jgi:hypothetical protein